MEYILCIETSTTVCSVCIASEEKVLALRETNNGYTHAENLHVFIDELVKESGVTLKQLSAVAVSKGPGSYTGLRIGVSAAKGFCYALTIPLIGIDTLQAMTAAVAREDMYYVPMLDARRMEVYCAAYDRALSMRLAVQALVLDENSIKSFVLDKPVCFFGNGMPKARTLLQTLPQAGFEEGVEPSSKYLAPLAHKAFAQKQFESLALFEPFYLKDFLIRKP